MKKLYCTYKILPLSDAYQFNNMFLGSIPISRWKEEKKNNEKLAACSSWVECVTAICSPGWSPSMCMIHPFSELLILVKVTRRAAAYSSCQWARGGWQPQLVVSQSQVKWTFVFSIVQNNLPYCVTVTDYIIQMFLYLIINYSCIKKKKTQ